MMPASNMWEWWDDARQNGETIPASNMWEWWDDARQ
jgi:hypothetical protein